jgi:transcriptional regulator with XRE-family HTH domain
MEDFGALLRRYRKKEGLSQKQLIDSLRQTLSEERWGISDVSKWEHGRMPKEEVVEQLEEILCTEKGLLLKAAGYYEAADTRRALEDDPTKREISIDEQHRELSDLLRRWREQLQFLSVTQMFHRLYLQTWRSEMELRGSEPAEIRELYLREWGRHFETFPRPLKAMLHIESETLFHRLKKSYPDAELWKAQQSWDEAAGMYLEAFCSWAGELEYATELAMGLAVMDTATNEDSDNSLQKARQLIQDAKKSRPDVRLILRLLVLTIGCDVLLLGIKEQRASPFWTLEVESIRSLRVDVVHTSMKELDSNHWLAGKNRPETVAESMFNSYEPVRENTCALLEALGTMYSAHNNVLETIQAFESSLYTIT